MPVTHAYHPLFRAGARVRHPCVSRWSSPRRRIELRQNPLFVLDTELATHPNLTMTATSTTVYTLSHDTTSHLPSTRNSRTNPATTGLAQRGIHRAHNDQRLSCASPPDPCHKSGANLSNRSEQARTNRDPSSENDGARAEPDSMRQHGLVYACDVSNLLVKAVF
jgi:hypothetical protein